MRRHSFSMARCPMDELVLIGIGTGSPDHLTREGEAEIRGADCILVPRKGAAKADLAELKKDICVSVLGEEAESRILEFDMPVRDSSPDYLESVDAWHGEIGKAWNAALEAKNAQRVALLVWGDPSLYDSTLRIAARLRPAPKVRVVPGITALQALSRRACYSAQRGQRAGHDHDRATVARRRLARRCGDRSGDAGRRTELSAPRSEPLACLVGRVSRNEGSGLGKRAPSRGCRADCRSSGGSA